MNAASSCRLSSAKVAGVLALLWCCGIVRAPRPLYAHADNCPLGGCQLAAPPALDWPLDPPAPTVTLKVRVPAWSPPGKEIEYRYFIENCALADAHHVIVKNPLPPNVKFVRASPAPHQTEPELQWHLGTMKARGKCEISLIVLPLGTEDVRNCVRIQYEHGQCVTTRVAHAQPGMPPFGSPEPPNGKGPPDGKRPPEIVPKIEPLPPDGLAKLKLQVEGPKDRYANMPVLYRITVINEGKTAATNLQTWATLPEKTEFVNASDNGVHIAGRVAWNLKDLEPGGKRTVELVYKSQGTGVRCVKVFALADRNVSAQAEHCTNFQGVSALLLEMFDRDDPVALGGDTSFPIVVQNTGNAPVNNVTVRALVPASMVLTKTVPAEHRLGERVPQGQWLIFGPMAPLAPGAQGQFEVHVKGVAAGDARFKIELSSDQLDRGPVVEEESTIIYEENGKVPVKMLSRQRK